jgi:hypothetical protein
MQGPEVGTPYETHGSRTKVIACELPSGPSGSNETDEAIEEKMGSHLDNIIGKLIVIQIEKQLSMDSPQYKYKSPDSMPVWAL